MEYSGGQQILGTVNGLRIILIMLKVLITLLPYAFEIPKFIPFLWKKIIKKREIINMTKNRLAI